MTSESTRCKKARTGPGAPWRRFGWIGSGILALWLVLMTIHVYRSTRMGPDAQALPLDRPLEISGLQQDWMEIFQGGNKIGYSVSEISPLDNGFLVQEDLLLKLNLMGQIHVLRAFTRCLIDRASRLREFTFRMSSGIVTFQISGRVEGQAIHLQIGEGARRREESLPIQSPPVIAAGMAHFFRGRKVRVGEVFHFPLFDPATLTTKTVSIRVAGEEDLEIANRVYPAYRLEMAFWTQPLRFWIDAQGALLKEEGFMGLTLVKSNPMKAQQGIEEGALADVYDLSAVPVKGRLPHPQGVTFLRLEAAGVDPRTLRESFPVDDRQRLSGNVIEVLQVPLPSSNRGGPHQASDEEISPSFLLPERFIESDDPVLVAQARETAAGAQDPLLVLRRLMGFVYMHLEKRPVLSVPSARQSLETRAGDCNEHAVLLTALARALGIPARVAVGLVYAKDKFYYHAWVEAFAGAWVALDPVMNQMPADATHLKIATGGFEKQAQILSLVGRLSLTILAYR